MILPMNTQNITIDLNSYITTNGLKESIDECRYAFDL